MTHASKTMPRAVAVPAPLDSGSAQATQADVALPAPLLSDIDNTRAGPLSAPLISDSTHAVALSAPLGQHIRVNRTFTVYTCNIPNKISTRYIPFAICRVKLVGCPGGGAHCRHWRYEEGLEMDPTGTALTSWTITTDIYEPGKGG